MAKSQYFTPHEKGYLGDVDFLLTKRAISDKINGLFNSALKQAEDSLKAFPSHALKNTFKISKGDNYKGLPYFVLDYPRLFSKKDVFNCRLLIWWGNLFSFSFHLEGQSRQQYMNQIVNCYEFLACNDYYLCTNDNPWEHYFKQDNFVSIEGVSREQFEAQIYTSYFLKISKKRDIEDIEYLIDFYKSCMQDVISIIS